jgi:pimeloyl-ACP methyl ester carboxylesterase
MPFEEAASSLRKRGYRIDFIPVSGRSGADYNAAQIAEVVEKIPASDAGRIVLIGHSKGAVDILHFLVNHPQAARRASAVVSVAGAVNGSPLAEYLAGTYEALFSRMPFTHCAVGDKEVASSLTRSRRMTWLASHRLPGSVKLFSLS